MRGTPKLTSHDRVSGQRVVTASRDKTARVWDIPTITRKDSTGDANLLADLAEALKLLVAWLYRFLDKLRF
jgi:hypothetical protein